MYKSFLHWTAAPLAVAIVGWVGPASATITYDSSSTLTVDYVTLRPLVLTTLGGSLCKSGFDPDF